MHSRASRRLARRVPALLSALALTGGLLAVAPAAVAGSTSAGLPGAAPASEAAPGPLGLGCAPYPGGDTICSGEVNSFDGSPLDVDVTLPAHGGASHPLMVMLHGFGANKHEWESTNNTGDNMDKYQWNSHWFAQHGYYVLTYTARGFRDDGTTRADEPNTPAGKCAGKGGSDCQPFGTIRVKNKDVEIRDTQYLSAQVAKAFPTVDPGRVAVTGDSYGGGESWLQAADPVWSFPQTIDPSLPALRLQVAVPKYGWTDLSYALLPNGHGGGPSGQDLYSSSQGRQDTNGVGNPPGVEKQSYVAGLYALGTEQGTFEEGQNAVTPPADGAEPYTAWLARIDAGEPYDAPGRVDDTVIGQIRTAFAGFHSAYYQQGWAAQAKSGQETAIFSINGWTDDLFEPVESFRMFTYLKSLDPRWPVSLGIADVGHSRAQNKPKTWQRLNNQANQFLGANINGSHRQQTTVFSEPTVCTGASTPAQQLTATTPEGLAGSTLTVDYTQPATLAPDSGAGDPNGPATDAVFGDVAEPGGGCRTAVSPTAGATGYIAYSAPLPTPQTYVGLGYVQADYQATPGAEAVLAERLWDVAPDGTTTLVSRGVYRFDFNGYDNLTGTVRVPFYGNHYTFAPGHKLRIDLQQVDAPTYRPPNAPVTSTLTLTPPRLVLPIRSANPTTVPGS